MDDAIAVGAGHAGIAEGLAVAAALAADRHMLHGAGARPARARRWRAMTRPVLDHDATGKHERRDGKAAGNLRE
jgi:hypothetical protein